MVLVYLIRHAQSAPNQDYSIIQGRAPEAPLTPLGESQSPLLADLLKQQGIMFSGWYSSPAKRALRTASRVREELFPVYCAWQILPEIHVLDDLQEVDQGEWTGRKVNEVYTSEYQQVIIESGGIIGPPKGESMVIAGRRMRSCLETIADRANERESGGAIAAFTHNNSIASFLFSAGMPINQAWTLHLKNTSMTILEYSSDERWKLLTLDQAPHLDGE